MLAATHDDLAENAADLLLSRNDPSRIAVVCATGEASREMRVRIARLLDARGLDGAALAGRLSISTADVLFGNVLGTPSARLATGRSGRLLTSPELMMMLADVRRECRLEGSEARAACERVFAGWRNLSSDTGDARDAGDAGNSQDRAMREAIEQWTRRTDSLAAPQAASLCASWLRSALPAKADKGGGEGEGPGIDYVLADDAELLSPAARQALALLAGKRLVVSESSLAPSGAPSDAPSGLSPEEVSQGSMKIRAKRHGMAPDIAVVKWPDPDEELQGVAETVLKMFRSDRTLAPGDFLVMAPTPARAREFGRELRRKRFDVCYPLTEAPLADDPRDRSRCVGLSAYTLLNIAACPDDAVAWRMWCAIGSADCGCRAWNELVRYAEGRGLALLDALDEIVSGRVQAGVLGGEISADAQSWLSVRRKEGLERAERARELSGFSLVGYLAGPHIPRNLEALLCAADGNEDVPALYAKLRDALLDPRSPRDGSAVRICVYSYERLAGLMPRIAIATGAVDGILLSRQAFFRALTLGSDRLVVTGWQTMDAGEAAKAGATVRRKRRAFGGSAVTGASGTSCATRSSGMSENGANNRNGTETGSERIVAVVSPSRFVLEAGDALPGSVSGEQYLSELAEKADSQSVARKWG
jgi:DNA helicase-2/ATP-dependent DNA helicase PcrA